ncbi:large ribosomal subunit protein bL35m [Procambarus clarkii]|uniref:large ribosomal subunit protein bL35m n=1 Tax=Procambarus clarkii TaxID=6728 RepID=UPI001E675217|nr:39S ribosomal protein L35, mitochondrial-like [Procambarus clarkii]XP_045582334.1 39S ribosomal protein L35, mitochondrial-like [Procambarus clarkii]
MLLRRVSRLSSYGRVLLIPSVPAVGSRNVSILTNHNGLRLNLSSGLLQCQFKTATVPPYSLASRTVPGLKATLEARMSTWFPNTQTSLLAAPVPVSAVQTRSVIKWSMRKGKRKSVKAVIKRFKRLDWAGRGIWIRARAGASKRMWKKSPAQRRRCKTHVFVNATQSNLLDKMVTRCWKRVRHYPDDPYKSYMRRDNYYLTRSYPREFY